MRAGGIAALFFGLALAACANDRETLTVTAATADAALTAVSSTTVVVAAPTTTSEAPLAAAEAEIRLAYATFSNVNVTQAERDAAVEDGEQHSAERMTRWEQFKDQAAFASFVIDEIRFVSATQADVDFHIHYGNGPSPVVPNVVHGGAVVQGGHWRVSRATTCALSSAVGTKCLD
jgi:hypothetical protein